MKILQVIPNLATGGAEVFVVSLCNALAKMGHEITIMTFYPKDDSQFLYKRLDKQVKQVLLPKHKGVDLLLPFRICKFIKNGKFDVAHFHVQSIIYSIISCMVHKECRYIATIHNDAYKEAQGLHRFARKYLFKNKLMLPITISDESKISFKELYKLKSEVIYNGVTTDYFTESDVVEFNKFRITPQTKVFTYVASVNEVKNQLNAAKAFNRLAKNGYDVALLVLGRITESDYCRQVKNESSKNVIVYGQTSNPVEFMKKSDFFMLVSQYEGMPISLLEAFSSRLIPIVTPVGGNKNLVHDEINGLICDSCEIDSICNVVKRAIELTEEQIAHMKDKLTQDFAEFSIETCAKKYVELYNIKEL